MKLYDELQGREKKLSRDDWAHGSLLIMNELLRCSNIEGEVIGKGFKSLLSVRSDEGVFIKFTWRFLRFGFMLYICTTLMFNTQFSSTEAKNGNGRYN